VPLRHRIKCAAKSALAASRNEHAFSASRSQISQLIQMRSIGISDTTSVDSSCNPDEMAHCRRFLRGDWKSIVIPTPGPHFNPIGFSPSPLCRKVLNSSLS
jgi:hypothetical protein